MVVENLISEPVNLWQELIFNVTDFVRTELIMLKVYKLVCEQLIVWS